jgi:hypothetical protein
MSKSVLKSSECDLSPRGSLPAEQRVRFSEHKPAFAVRQFAEGRWWIVDGETQVGLLTRPEDFVELVNWNPLDPRRKVAFPEIYHAPTAPGDRITMAKWIGAQSTTSQRSSLRFEGGGADITAVFEEEWDNGRTATTILRFAVDPDWGYMIEVDAEMRSPFPEPAEFCNLLPEHVVDDRPEFLRYPYVLWQHPDGGVRRWNQNNIGARALGAMDIRERRRIQTGGFLGCFGEQDRNPVVEIVDASPAVTAQTCPNMLDEHIQWLPTPAGQLERTEDDRFLSRVRYRLFSVPGAVSEALSARAEMVDMILERIDMELEREYVWCAREHPRWPGEPKHLRYCALQMGKVCDFESKLDPAAAARASVFCYLDDGNLPVSVVSDMGRSGTHSLRLRPAGGTASASPAGTTIHLTAGQRYRLSAWVKTALYAGSATIRAEEFLFSPANPLARHETTVLHGVADEWRQLVLEFTAHPRAHGVSIVLEANGIGEACFDDILIEKLHPNA